MKRGSTFILASMLGLSACTPATMGELRKEAPAAEQYVVAENYQVVYRRVVESMRRCWSTQTTEADLYTDIQSAQIAILYASIIGRSMYMGMDLKAIDSGSTNVTTRIALSTWRSNAALANAWAKGTTNDCHL
jgi:hypothetical protein